MPHRRRILTASTIAAVTLCAASGCFGTGNGGQTGDSTPDVRQDDGDDGTAARASDARRRYSLDDLGRITISAGEHAFEVWLAQDFDDTRPGVVQEGLMHVPEEELAGNQGMLFVFSDERVRSFWMLNTITPLDIAYARFDGTIVRIAQMDPLTLRSHSSIEPAMFALEVKQGTFARLGIREGDRLTIPQSAFEVQP